MGDGHWWFRNKDLGKRFDSKESGKCRDLSRRLWKEADNEKIKKLDNLHNICEKFKIIADEFKMEMNKISYEKRSIRFETQRKIYKMINRMIARVDKIDKKREKYMNNEVWINKSVEEIEHCNNLIGEMLQFSRIKEGDRENRLIGFVEEHVNNKLSLQRLLKRFSRYAWCCLSHREGSTSGGGSDYQPESSMGRDVVKSMWEGIEEIKRKKITNDMKMQMMTYKLDMLDLRNNIRQSSEVKDYKRQKMYEKKLAVKEKEFKKKLKKLGIEWNASTSNGHIGTEASTSRDSIFQGKQPEVQEEGLYCKFSRDSTSKEELQQMLGQVKEYCCLPQNGSTIKVGQRMGDYCLVRELGRGSFAEVFLGEKKSSEDISSKEQVAVKVLILGGQTDGEKFCREINNLASLDHPNIVSLLGFGSKDNVSFLVTEYAPGGTFRDKYLSLMELELAEYKRPSLTELAECMEQIGSAISYMHNEGLLHLDIKPDNLLLGDNNKFLVGDLGSAASVNAKVFGGDIGYRAPEQKKGEPCPASDQYALALVACELLVGKNPVCSLQDKIEEESPFSNHHEIEKRAHNELSAFIASNDELDIPSKVRSVLARALEEDPKKRYSDVKVFAQELAQVCR